MAGYLKDQYLCLILDGDMNLGYSLRSCMPGVFFDRPPGVARATSLLVSSKTAGPWTSRAVSCMFPYCCEPFPFAERCFVWKILRMTYSFLSLLSPPSLAAALLSALLTYADISLLFLAPNSATATFHLLFSFFYTPFSAAETLLALFASSLRSRGQWLGLALVLALPLP